MAKMFKIVCFFTFFRLEITPTCQHCKQLTYSSLRDITKMNFCCKVLTWLCWYLALSNSNWKAALEWPWQSTWNLVVCLKIFSIGQTGNAFEKWLSHLYLTGLFRPGALLSARPFCEVENMWLFVFLCPCCWAEWTAGGRKLSGPSAEGSRRCSGTFSPLQRLQVALRPSAWPRPSASLPLVRRCLGPWRLPTGCPAPDCPQWPMPGPHPGAVHGVWPLTQFFPVSFLWKLIDLPGRQINDPSSGKHYSL